MADHAKQAEMSAAPTKGVPQKPEPIQQIHVSGPGPVRQPHSARVQRKLSGPADILPLQQTIGNQAVMRLLDKQRSGVQAKLAESSEEESVQRLGEDQREPSNAEIHSAAARGISTPATTLPFLDRIQASFGRHSIGHIKAHVGPEAARAAQDMNAVAYASGNHVVFDKQPDLHTAAHEAAHVVQQRAGVQLAGGVGRRGDAYEQNANAVADTVVAGRAAEGLLNTVTFLETDNRKVDNPRWLGSEAPSTSSSLRSEVVQQVPSNGTSVISLPPSHEANQLINIDVLQYTSPDLLAIPENTIELLEMEIFKIKMSNAPVLDKIYAIGRLENEVRMAREAKLDQCLMEEMPGDTEETSATTEHAPTYTNKGKWKDWYNVILQPLKSRQFWSYPEDPTTLEDVHWLRKGTVFSQDGYYAYVFRVKDKEIVYTYNGPSQALNNVIPHSYLASGGDVYAAGTFLVTNGKIAMVNSASGHYEPDPRIELNEDCFEEVTSDRSLREVRAKLESLGHGEAWDIDMHPFRNPTIEQKKIECQDKKFGWSRG